MLKSQDIETFWVGPPRLGVGDVADAEQPRQDLLQLLGRLGVDRVDRQLLGVIDDRLELGDADF
jgi:hypothetical protein